MPIIEAQKELVTALSRKDIDALTGMIAGKTVTRTADKSKAIARFEKMLSTKLGKSAEDEVWEILGKTGFEIAQGALHAALEDAPEAGEAAEMDAAPEPTAEEPEAAPEAPESVSDGTEEDEEQVAANDPDRSGVRGKESSFAGKQIFSAKDENPRRAGSHGWRSMEIIRNNPGITYENFIKAGGRRNDLAWDITHGNVRLT